MQILLLYDHWNDAQMVFEGCYQFVVLTYFIIRIVNEFFNHDKVFITPMLLFHLLKNYLETIEDSCFIHVICNIII